jgi:hypothetical protein
MLQKESAESGGHVPLIFITHKAREQAMLAALKELDPAIVEYHRMIRVEGKSIC